MLNVKQSLRDLLESDHGILVSKAFYTTFQAIRNCVSAVTDFNTELEYTQMIFTNMSGSVDVATE